MPKIMPVAHELKNVTGNGTGARNRQAKNPNRYARPELDPDIRRTSDPVSAATASSRIGRTTKFLAAIGSDPKTVIAAADSHSSPQWYQVCSDTPGSDSKPEGRMLVSMPVVARSRPRIE